MDYIIYIKLYVILGTLKKVIIFAAIWKLHELCF